MDLSISTPVAGMDLEHERGAAAAPAAPPHAPPPHASAGAAAAGARATSIPAVSYTMPPGLPTWRVKPQFAAWEVDHSRFEIRRALGKGSYGSVVEAIDHLTGRRVAIKKINDIFGVFENAKRIFREVRILADLHHPNVVALLHICQPPDLLRFTDLYVVFECMDTDLAKLCKDDTQTLTVPHVRCVGLAVPLTPGASAQA